MKLHKYFTRIDAIMIRFMAEERVRSAWNFRAEKKRQTTLEGWMTPIHPEEILEVVVA